VPSDLEPRDGRETFTIAVEYDTKKLYGKVKAERTFIITK